MRIYLSAGFYHAIEMEDVRRELEKRGHKVVSTWHSRKPQSALDGAMRDFKDIVSCDVLVQFTDCAGFNSAAELGIALGAGKKTILVGHEEGWTRTIFHNLAGLRFDTLVEFLRFSEALK